MTTVSSDRAPYWWEPHRADIEAADSLTLEFRGSGPDMCFTLTLRRGGEARDLRLRYAEVFPPIEDDPDPDLTLARWEMAYKQLLSCIQDSFVRLSYEERGERGRPDWRSRSDWQREDK